MSCRTIARLAALLSAAVIVACFLPSPALSQNTNVTNNNLQQNGVIIDAQGVLRTKTYDDPGAQLTRQRIAAAKAALDPKITAFSALRKISLNRLEALIRQQNGVISDDMRNLAGLQRIRYVFFYPETKDIVIAGPAEGWITAPSGRIVGITSGRPVVQLQDLVVGLRSFPPSGKHPSFIGCSIDPTPEGLAAMQQYLNSLGTFATPAMTQSIVEGLRTRMGYQNISVSGVSPKTRFAQVMVEADYRMKLIGIGLEKPPVKLVSYVDRARPNEVGRNALQRWYFIPDYQCVRVSADYQAMELVGDGVKLVDENELVAASGQRQVNGSVINRASQAFVTGFTKIYPELADRAPVYADLRNLIDIAVAAAFIQQQDYYGKAGWKMEFFGSEAEFPVETSEIPKTVETVVNAKWKGNTLFTPVGGGVQIQPTKALESDKLLNDDKGKVAKLREEIKINLAKGQWWWD
jgi:hypothetical protein